MWTLKLNVVLIFCFLCDNSILHTEAANLFDAVGSVIGLDAGNGKKNLNLLPSNNNQFRNNFNNNNFNNNNFRPNNQFQPKPKPFIPNGVNNGAFNNGGFTNGGINNNNFRPLPNNNNNKLPNNNGGVLVPFREDSFSGLTEEEKRAAQQYPGIAKLLAQLRELNRQKELQNQNGQNGVNGNGNNNMINGGTAKNGWKILQRRKFVFQAKPVRPDNEIVAASEKVYYLD